MTWRLFCIFISLLPGRTTAQVINHPEAYVENSTLVYEAVLQADAKAEKALWEDYPKGHRIIYYLADSTDRRGLLEYNYRDPNQHHLAPDTNVLYTDASWRAFLSAPTRPDTLRDSPIQRRKIRSRGYQLRSLAHLRSKDSWRTGQIPDAPIVSFSPVIFSADLTKAIVYQVSYSGPEQAGGSLIYLEKQAGKWQLVAYYLVWIS